MIELIRLTKDNLYKLKQSYINLMFNGVKQRYDIEKSKKAVINPFTKLPYIAIFENEKSIFDEEIIKALLGKPIVSEKTGFKEVDSYILTGQLIFYSKFSVDKVLKDRRIKIEKKSREKLRKEFVGKYSSQWLENYKKMFPNYYKTSKEFEEFIKHIEIDLLNLNKEISKIIDYSYLEDEFRHNIICKMGVDVCPYCNRQYITSYLENGNNRTTADLDHFLPKSIFTLLSLSLFNFIPSCQICNLRFKSNKRSNILYPYEDGFGNDAYFTLEINDMSNFESLIGNNDCFDLKLVVNNGSNNKTKIDNNIEMFKINQVYQIHKQYIRELCYKKTKYNEAYKTMICKLMEDLNLNSEELDLFLYGYSFNDDELYTKPLSKLTYDIIKR